MALREIPGPGPKRKKKHNSLILEVPAWKKKVAKLSGMVFRIFVTFFSPSESHGREIAKYAVFRSFWPRTPLGTFEKFRAGVENGKTQFPDARGTFGGEIGLPQRFLPESAQLFYILDCCRPDPHGREIVKCRHIVIKK